MFQEKISASLTSRIISGENSSALPRGFMDQVRETYMGTDTDERPKSENDG